MPLDVSLDDAALVRASLGGDQEAFGVLVSRHARSILSVTTRMLGPAADAEDVAQETFVAAFKSLTSFQFDAKFSTWLYRIAVNKCTDALRARRPTVSLDEAGDDEATPRGRPPMKKRRTGSSSRWSWRGSSTRGSRRCRISIASRSCSNTSKVSATTR